MLMASNRGPANTIRSCTRVRYSDRPTRVRASGVQSSPASPVDERSGSSRGLPANSASPGAISKPG
jgi:hypothetical protein